MVESTARIEQVKEGITTLDTRARQWASGMVRSVPFSCRRAGPRGEEEGGGDVGGETNITVQHHRGCVYGRAVGKIRRGADPEHLQER